MSEAETTLYQIDAFTDRPFAGNPAAVCLLPAPQPDGWMQQVALEMNLSETAFLVRRGDAFALRWFTPAVEVDLCGHATLASAHMLWATGVLPPEARARFDTRSGRLEAWREDGWIWMDFPAEPPEKAAPPQGLLAALDLSLPTWVGRNRMDYLIEVADAEQVRRLSPNLVQVAACGGRGVIVTARADQPGVDFVSRFFAPAVGVPEDPVTGSAHCALAPYWEQRLGPSQLVGHQASARGGRVRVQTKGDRVWLGGQAVLVLQAQLLA